VLEDYRTSVFRFLHRFVDDPAAAEEMAQEVFLQAYRAFARKAPPIKCDIWLFQRALDLALGKGNRSGTVANANPGALVWPVRRAMAGLPPAQRAAVLMHKYETFDYSKIGRVLGCSVYTVQYLLTQAYQNLRAEIRDDVQTVQTVLAAEPR